jgi:sugar lactone lactonase YvrE
MTCAGPVPSGALIDTSSAGTKSFTVTATDIDGNSSTQTVNYAVALVASTGNVTADRVLGQLNFNDQNPLDAGLAVPAGVAIDAAGNLYVSDAENNRVLGYASADSFVKGEPPDLVIGQPDLSSVTCNDGMLSTDANGLGPDSLCSPQGLAVDSGSNLLVADAGNNRVFYYSAPFQSGQTTGQSAAFEWGQPNFMSNGCSTFNSHSPCGICNSPTRQTLCNPQGVTFFIPDRAILVADTNNSRVLEFPQSGPVASAVFGQRLSYTVNKCNGGQNGLGADSLCNPTGVVQGSGSDFFVADTANNRVLHFPFGGNAENINHMGESADTVFGQGAYNSFASNNQSFGGSSGLNNPTAVAADNSGNLYVVDYGNSRVLEYNAPLFPNPPNVIADAVFGQGQQGTGTALSLYGCNDGMLMSDVSGLGPDSLCLVEPGDAAGIAIDQAGDLFAADTDNNRVLGYQFSTTTNLPNTLATSVIGQSDFVHGLKNAPGAAQLKSPVGTAIDITSTPNHLYVADRQNNRVLGYKNGVSFANGAPADIVIGQPHFSSTSCASSVGAATLCQPNGVAVDGNGNLYVADTANDRVLEYTAPFASVGFLAGQTAGFQASVVF